MNTNETKVIEHEGDRWRVISVGSEDAAGRVYCHLASTTRFCMQRNGSRPIQIGDWIPREVLA